VEISHLFAGLPVSDYDRALAWYGELFDREPDMLPKEGEAVWRFGDASVYIVVDAERAGSGLLTIAVSGLPPDRRIVHDPDGNTVQLFGT
jgi:hypothetical protein